MNDRIHVLPESISNKIAAGEVVQGPFSIVKELLENSIDAGATEIKLTIEDSGKTLIQVVDNGIGMSAKDIKMCLKKHSTSKIKDIEDLYTIKTMGFRGEAIASIVSVSKVEIISNTSDSEIGTKILVEDSNIVSKENIFCKKGTIFTVKNIFYNIPARRAFLKSDNLELIHIVKEFIRISLANPEVSFKFVNNNEVKYNLIASTLLKRISEIFKNKGKNNLIFVSENEDILKINGYIIKPSEAKKNDEIFIYVNKRFVINNELKTQIINSYKNLITTDKVFCVLNIEIDPKNIDINVSPSKTDIKFKNEQLVYALIHNIIKKKLYYCKTPELNFDSNDWVELNNVNLQDFNTDNNNNNTTSNDLFDENSQDNYTNKTNYYSTILVVNNEYIVSTVKSGLIIINANRALKRITYDRIYNNLDKNIINSQQLLFPNRLFLGHEGTMLLKTNEDFLKKLGFIFVFETTSVLITGIPNFMNINNITEIIDLIISILKTGNKTEIYEDIIKGILSTKGNINLKNSVEAKSLLNNLFILNDNMYDPFGKRIFMIINSCNLDDILDN